MKSGASRAKQLLLAISIVFLNIWRFLEFAKLVIGMSALFILPIYIYTRIWNIKSYGMVTYNL
jgi:hypothetical protein